MSIRQTVAATLLVGAGLINAQAAPLAGDGSWNEFAVDSVYALSGGVEWIDLDGAPLSFDFTIGAGQQGVLTVVDAVIAGDTFTVYNGATPLGTTSPVALHTYAPDEPTVGDFDLALADPNFSRASFTLGAGSYSITGALAQSVLLGTEPLNATLGGVRLEVSPVPEPASLALLAAGLGLLRCGARRRSR